MSAGSLGTSLNLLYFLAIGVSIFSYSFSTPIFLALKSDSLYILRLYSILLQPIVSLMLGVAVGAGALEREILLMSIEL